MRPRVVVFDVAGTLLDLARPVGRIYSEEARAVGQDLDPAALESGFAHAHREAGPLAFGHLDPEARLAAERAWWRAIAERALDAAGAPPGTWREAFFDRVWYGFAGARAWRVFDDVRPALRALRRRAAPLAVFSNWDSRLEALLGALGIDGYFARVLVSSALPAAKPDAAGFVAVGEALGELCAEPPIMVGDRIENDIAPARAAGWDAVWVDRLDRGPGGLPGDALRIADLRELPAAIERIG